MMTSPNLSALSNEDLVKRLSEKDHVIALLTIFSICFGITAFSVGFASGFVTKGVANAITQTNRN